jgi:hypothetical protein
LFGSTWLKTIKNWNGKYLLQLLKDVLKWSSWCWGSWSSGCGGCFFLWLFFLYNGLGLWWFRTGDLWLLDLWCDDLLFRFDSLLDC